jgi:large subunit ribosomal protein L19
MKSVAQEISDSYKKAAVVAVKSGDSIRVHQRIKEGNKERIQIFEGLVIRTDRMNSATATITVRRSASGVGVEKTYLLHSPLVTRIEVTKRSKIRRNYLSYMRQLKGKSARLVGMDFDRNAVNDIHDEAAEQAEAEAKAAAEAEAAAKQAEKDAAQAELEAKQKAAEAAHQQAK